MLRIREATLSDTEDLYKFQQRVSFDENTNVNFSSYFKECRTSKPEIESTLLTSNNFDKGFILYKENESNIIGYVLTKLKNKLNTESFDKENNEKYFVYICQLGVDPSYQSTGLGKKMMLFVEDYFKLSRNIAIKKELNENIDEELINEIKKFSDSYAYEFNQSNKYLEINSKIISKLELFLLNFNENFNYLKDFYLRLGYEFSGFSELWESQTTIQKHYLIYMHKKMN